MPLVTKAERQDIRTLLSFPEGSAGSVMTTEYASLPADVTVGDAIALLRQQAPSRETIYYIYVLDEAHHLLGFVSLRDLILAKPTARVADIMQRDVISVRVDQDQEEAARELAKYDFLALPVVDDQHRLVGIITHDDVIDVMIEEATEDAQQMGGIVPMVEDYLEAPFLTVWRKRAAWLSCLFVAELFTFTALAHFEDEIAAVAGPEPVRAAVHLDGRQLRLAGGHADYPCAWPSGRSRPRDWWRALRHELLVGLALGLTLGAIGFVRAAMTPAVGAGQRRPLDAGPGHRPGRGRHLPVGHARRLDAAAGLQAAGLRSRLRLEPVRRHVRRRDGHRHLLLDRQGAVVLARPLHPRRNTIDRPSVDRHCNINSDIVVRMQRRDRRPHT